MGCDRRLLPFFSFPGTIPSFPFFFKPLRACGPRDSPFSFLGAGNLKGIFLSLPIPSLPHNVKAGNPLPPRCMSKTDASFPLLALSPPPETRDARFWPFPLTPLLPPLRAKNCRQSQQDYFAILCPPSFFLPPSPPPPFPFFFPFTREFAHHI